MIRTAACKNAAVKSRDLANGRINVCEHVCARSRVRHGKEDLGGVWQKGYGHSGRVSSVGVHGCTQACSTWGLFMAMYTPVTVGHGTGTHEGLPHLQEQS